MSNERDPIAASAHVRNFNASAFNSIPVRQVFKENLCLATDLAFFQSW